MNGWDAKRQDGQTYLHVEKISHIGPMEAMYCSLPPDGMSDDRPTAAHVHTKGDRMDHTAGLGRGTRAGSCMHASLLQDDCDLVPVQHGRGQHRSVTIISETSSPLLVPHTGSTRTARYLRTESILVTFDSRGFPASRAPLLLASAFPDFSHHRPWNLDSGDGCIRVFHARCHKETSIDKESVTCAICHYLGT